MSHKPRPPKRTASLQQTQSQLASTFASSTSSSSSSIDKNIQVIVRCRAPHPHELSLPLLASTSSPLRGHSITLSSLSSSSSTKTYNFGTRPSNSPSRPPLGNVFGPQADQGLVYEDVAKPILAQVLQGYNCTLFAYGQTGTGKTYTMEGDLRGGDGGGFSDEAGIIPRALWSLFGVLEKGGGEWSVRASYVELYNEELRDLNASGSGSGGEEDGGLKIFEEKNGSGVFIQGLEETLIRSAEEGLKILKRGSERRMIAATKCNDHSSRSHSIFTLTLHMKEVSSTGEELIKIGKLNLVDLAGSENVGRSGAVQVRAREAGMINTSLLALGRVINKLVEGGGHIPYRESKLTRLLADSLGGRTRTTIIATISPVNFEETASTLDYALRAKSIQNRPEVNQRMTKLALISQLAQEIESLKRDLVATREKSGIYLSPDTHSALLSESSVLRTQLSTASSQIELLDSQLSSTRAQYEQNLVIVKIKEEECKRLEGVERELKAEREERERVESERDGLRMELERERERSRGWEEKLERKEFVETSNRETLSNLESSLLTQSSDLNSQVLAFESLQSSYLNSLISGFDSLSADSTSKSDQTTSFITSQLSTLSTLSNSLLSTLSTSSTSRDTFLNSLDATQRSVTSFLASEESKWNSVREERKKEILVGFAKAKEEVVKGVEGLLEPLREVERAGRERGVEDERVLEEWRNEEKEALVEENARLTSLVTSLQHSLTSLRETQSSSNDSLLLLLKSALEDRSNKIEKIVGSSVEEVENVVEGIRESSVRREGRREEVFGEVVEKGREVREEAKVVLKIGEMDGERVKKMVETSVDSLNTKFSEYSTGVSENLNTLNVFVEREMNDLTNVIDTYRTDASSSNDVMAKEMNKLSTNTKVGYETIAKQVEELQEGSSEKTSQMRIETRTHQTESSTFLSSTTDSLSTFSSTLSSHLSPPKFLHDIPTGQTPRKTPKQLPLSPSLQPLGFGLSVAEAEELGTDLPSQQRQTDRQSGISAARLSEVLIEVVEVAEEVPVVPVSQVGAGGGGGRRKKVLREVDANTVGVGFRAGSSGAGVAKGKKVLSSTGKRVMGA